MRYRNSFVFALAVAGLVAQPAVLVWIVFFDQVFSGNAEDTAALIALFLFTSWLFVRVGVQPVVDCEEDTIVVRNPVFSYRAPLSRVRLHGRGGALGLWIEGVGVIHPWVLSRSVFDGARARAARQELRERLAANRDEGAEGADPARRWVRWGVPELLLVFPVVFLIWSFVAL
ncbi:hypothetical protein [Streptomyces yaizuensis]|uniref:PH domain-containing protein n=1 Tax=Streptomyces yaizuensis TaxID=2989713 RepID=A0ABQ5NX19_9ACTN|nr:hypothetical protein [Streptomyces sp. YSPA8]GLF94918.1 hypothetical protein SYYSPA8_11495 [Streptomyces sp. YSPA8]